MRTSVPGSQGETGSQRACRQLCVLRYTPKKTQRPIDPGTQRGQDQDQDPSAQTRSDSRSRNNTCSLAGKQACVASSG